MHTDYTKNKEYAQGYHDARNEENPVARLSNSVANSIPSGQLGEIYRKGYEKGLEDRLAEGPQTARATDKPVTLPVAEETKKRNLPRWMMFVSAILVCGLLLAFFLPFLRPNNAEVEKTVTNNLRQLSGAADQYVLENGVSKVSGKDLIGPRGYFKEVKSVDGEDYESLVFEAGKPIRIKTKRGLEIVFYR